MAAGADDDDVIGSLRLRVSHCGVRFFLTVSAALDPGRRRSVSYGPPEMHAAGKLEDIHHWLNVWLEYATQHRHRVTNNALRENASQ